MQTNYTIKRQKLALCHFAIAAALIVAVSCHDKTDTSPVPPPDASAGKGSGLVPANAEKTSGQPPATQWELRLAKVTDINGRVALVREIQAKKSVDAVPFLVAHLAEITPVSISNALSFDQTFPCTSALIDIGDPSVNAVAQAFAHTQSETERHLQIYVLAQIKGKEWAATFLENKIALAATEDAKNKLRSSQEWVRSLER